jgi:hypothetical protein
VLLVCPHHPIHHSLVSDCCCTPCLATRAHIAANPRTVTLPPQVTEYLAAHGPPAWYKLKKKAARRAAREEAARRRWRVVVVGAGPAGLTAALHLKVGRRAGESLAQIGWDGLRMRLLPLQPPWRFTHLPGLRCPHFAAAQRR